MSAWLDPWIVEALGETLLHFLWQGVLVGAGLELVLVAMRKASSDARYLVRCGALALMALLPPLTFSILAPPSAVPAFAVGGVSGSAPLPVAPNTLLELLVAGWAAGALLLSMRTAGGWLRLAWLRSAASSPLPPAWQRTFARLARELRVSAQAVVVDSATIAVPTVIGWLRPVVLVPARVLTGLGEIEIEVLLAHELAHVRRADYLVNLLQSLVEALLFFHPVVWRISSGIRSEREFCCDDAALAVTGDGISFARALTELETWRGEQARLALSTLGGSLMHRIQRMVGIEVRAPRAARVGQALAAFVAAGSLGAAALALSPHEDAHADVHAQEDAHAQEGCAGCENAARREHDRRAEREEVERFIAQSRAEIAELRAMLAAERAAREGARARWEEVREQAPGELLVEVRDDDGVHVGEMIVEVLPDGRSRGEASIELHHDAETQDAYAEWLAETDSEGPVEVIEVIVEELYPGHGPHVEAIHEELARVEEFLHEHQAHEHRAHEHRAHEKRVIEQLRAQERELYQRQLHEGQRLEERLQEQRLREERNRRGHVDAERALVHEEQVRADRLREIQDREHALRELLEVQRAHEQEIERLRAKLFELDREEVRRVDERDRKRALEMKALAEQRAAEQRAAAERVELERREEGRARELAMHRAREIREQLRNAEVRAHDAQVARELAEKLEAEARAHREAQRRDRAAEERRLQELLREKGRAESERLPREEREDREEAAQGQGETIVGDVH